MNLPHVPYMGNNRDIKFFGQKAYQNKFGNATNPYSINLVKGKTTRLDIIFKYDLVGNLLTKGQFNIDPFYQFHMGKYVDRMGWFFHPVGIKFL